jgi:hypothetical protein
MLSPEKFFQIERRAAQGTGLFSAFFGGLLVRLSGDFLQLPPVRAASFAGHNMPDSETKKAKPEPDSSDDEMDDETAEERKLGVTHFRNIRNVVCLNRVVRAPNALGALCTFIRHCKITDDVWTLLQSRVIRPNDTRLSSTAWTKNPLKLIVQRHALRMSMSNTAVMEHAKDMTHPVYLVAARDDVDCALAETVQAIQEMMQSTSSYKKTGRKQSLLMLYKGARMLLEGKDCALLGLMNGTEVLVEDIVLSPLETITSGHEKSDSNVIPLKFMPEGLLVRAVNESWILPEHLLPGLPSDTPMRSRRGLFFMRASDSCPFRVTYQGTKYRVRRTQFPLIPANAVIVYGAQGESYETAIADLGIPPNQDAHIFGSPCM